MQFYLAWLDHIAPIRRAGLDIAYPRMSHDDKQMNATRTFDIALASKLSGSATDVVTNDLPLGGDERILVVSGPNQGGKTTLARTFGQLYHLALLGCPVPGTDISLHLPDAIYSHFEREEHLETLSGKLEDEGIRIRGILTTATGNSVVIMNEMFNSITVTDAHILSERVLNTLSDLDAVRCFPTVTPVGSAVLNTQGLCDVCLQLQIDRRDVANTFDADSMKLVMVTGANQGGKSTFLRSVGLAHLMSGAGMFAAAATFSASARTSIASHFKREEDNTMTSGKFDEELARMSRLADTLARGSLLLCNESFQSTNEREGSEIGREVINAITEAGATVVFVTHLYDLASGFYAELDAIPALFLRADRDDQGRRPFQLVVAEPLPTGYGQDVYGRIVGADTASASHASTLQPEIDFT